MIVWLTEIQRNGTPAVETLGTDNIDAALSAAIGVLQSARDERKDSKLTTEITVTVRKLERPQ